MYYENLSASCILDRKTSKSLHTSCMGIKSPFNVIYSQFPLSGPLLGLQKWSLGQISFLPNRCALGGQLCYLIFKKKSKQEVNFVSPTYSGRIYLMHQRSWTIIILLTVPLGPESQYLPPDMLPPSSSPESLMPHEDQYGMSQLPPRSLAGQFTSLPPNHPDVPSETWWHKQTSSRF